MKNKKESFVYRVMLNNEWDEFKKKKKFFGNKLDIQSGFIHLSTKSQIKNTIEKYYKNEDSIIIFKINVKDIAKNLKWEISRNNQLFPHLYGFINFIDVKKTKLI
jgi:uncharacterized protein (DUF952 family)|tara:strand:- start:480 stop:794 length:315 start_codon:yes stop_codon:yes gene_type:complete